jgi:hypothetical protein
MRALRGLALCLTAGLAPACVIAPPVVAQGGLGTAALKPGARVRVTEVRRARWTARVVALRPDTLTVQWERRRNGAERFMSQYGDTVALALASVERLEVSGGEHREVGRGMGLGLVLGALAGGVVGASRNETRNASAPDHTPCPTASGAPPSGRCAAPSSGAGRQNTGGMSRAVPGGGAWA